MRGLVRRSAWAALMGLACGGTAFGQTTAKHAANTSRPVPPRAVSPQPSGPTDRQAEIAIELAWLAEPKVFPCNLGVRVEAGQVKVWGFVPSAAAKETALRLAHQQAGLRVVDSLRLQANMAAGEGEALPPEQMRTQAQEILNTVAAGTVQIHCRSDGTVTLSGVVHSPEEKLVCSKQLRRLPGCTAVTNNLQIVPGAGDGRRLAQAPIAPATPKLEEAKAVPSPSPATAVAPTPIAKTPDLAYHPPVWQPATHGKAPARLPETKTAAGSKPGERVIASTSPPAKEPIDSKVVPAVYETTPTSVGEGSALPSTTEVTPPAAPKETTAPMLPTATPPALPAPTPIAPVLPEAKAPTAPTTPTPSPAPATNSLRDLTKEGQNALPPLPLPVPPRPSTESLPKVDSKAAAPSVPSAPVSRVSDLPTTGGAAAAQPAVKKGAYERTGVVLLAEADEETPPVPAVKQAPQTPTPPPGFENQIRLAAEAACDRGARDVNVVLRAPGEVLIQFTAPNEILASRYFDRIQRLPELAAYKVEIEVSLPQ